MKKYLKYFLWIALFVTVFTAFGAFADGATASASTTDVFGTITTRLKDTFMNIRNVIFIIGGFGLIGLGFGAIFGKIKWPWLAALAGGLAIVALAGALINYVTDSKAAGYEDHSSVFYDTNTLIGN